MKSCVMRGLLTATLVSTLFAAPGALANRILRDDATGGDCTAIGTWDPLAKVCTLTGPVTESVRLADDDLTLDCDGHSVVNGAVGAAAVAVAHLNNATVKNCVAESSFYGILFSGATNGQIIDNTARNNTGPGAIRLDQSASGNVVRGNVLENNVGGIVLFIDSNDNVIVDNLLRDGGGGIKVSTDCVSNTVTGNSIDGAGISLGIGADYNIVSSNVIENSPSHGINNTANTGNTIEANTVRHAASIGIYLAGGSSDTTVSDNLVEGSDQGIAVTGANNVVTDNQIVNSLTNGLTISGDSSNHSIEGNVISGSGTVGLRVLSSDHSFLGNSSCHSTSFDVFDDGTTNTWIDTTCDTTSGRGSVVCTSDCTLPPPVIDPTAELHPSVAVGNGSTIGAGTTVGPDTLIGESVDIGEDVEISREVTLGDGVVIESETIIASGVVIGATSEIGAGVTISKDAEIGIAATIGDSSQIGRGATVTDGAVVPDGTIVANGSVF